MADQNLQISLTPRSVFEDFTASMASASGDSVTLQEISHMTQINLRGDAGDPALLAGVKKALGLTLPTKANTSVSKGGIAALWLGPDEWLILAEEGDNARLVSTLKLMLSDLHVAIVDLSNNRAIRSLSGPKVWDVLSKVATLDFHPRSWKTGDCAQSLCGKAQVIYWYKQKGPDFYLFIRPSFAGYLTALLTDAMAEFKG